MSETLKHTIEPEVNVQHPYLGLSSFHERHKSYFYGRNSEIDSLNKIIRRSTLTVFFGKSGLGKSSLLRAGLFPILRSNYQLPIYLRINFGQSNNKNPIDQIKTELSQAIQAMDKEAPDIGEMSLWEYFHRLTILNGLVQPVLVFDQFEEVFTLGNHAQVDKLFEELGDLIENRVPLSVQKQYGNENLPFSHQSQNFKVIFSLREDYLAQLEHYSALIPSILQNRFRLHQLNLEHALEAVYEPAKEIIEKKEAQRIVGLLAIDLSESSKVNIEGLKNKIEIEPFLLSLICDRINQLRFDSEGNMLSEKITSEILDKVNIKQIVAAFYKEIASTNSEELNTFIEKHLLTSDGYRRLQPMIDTQELFNVPEQEIQELIDKRILRKEIWNGREQVELIHDVLVPVVRERRDYRLKKERDLEVQKVLEKQKSEQQEKFQIDKIKQRNKYIVFGVFLALLTAIAVYFYNNQKNQYRERVLAMAQELSYKSSILTFWDRRLKGILARHAFEFAHEHGGRIDEGIYMSLYNSLEFLDGPGFGVDYKLLKNGSSNHNNLRDFILDETNLYSITKSGNILNWDFLKGKLDTIASINEACSAIDADLENGFLFVLGKESQLLSFDIHNDFKKTTIPVDDQIRVILNEKDNSKMFAAGSKGIIYSWDMAKDFNRMMESRDSIKILEAIENIRITSLASNKMFLAVGTSKHGVYLIDKSKRDTIKISFEGKIPVEHDSRITSMNFSSNGEILAIGNITGVLMFYNINSQDFSSIQYHAGDIVDICDHPNSSTMAASVGDGSVTLWDLDSFEKIIKLEQEIGQCKQSAKSILFDNSGDNLYAGYEDGSIIRWPINFSKLSDDICKVLNENMYNYEIGVDSSYLPKLSDSEWSKYMNNEIYRDQKYECP